MAGNNNFDLLSEGMISLGQAARLFPSPRRNGPVSPSCVWRWVRHGVKEADGRVVKLEAIQFCGRWVTSRPAIQRFIDAQQPQNPADNQIVIPLSAEARRRAASQAEKELIKRGL